MTTRSTGTTGQHADGQHASEQHASEQQPATQAEKQRRPAVNSGNPRITVAFPLSRIDIREPSEALRDLAKMVEQLAEQVAVIAREVAPDQGEASDWLAAEAALLARRIGTDS